MSKEGLPHPHRVYYANEISSSILDALDAHRKTVDLQDATTATGHVAGCLSPPQPGNRSPPQTGPCLSATQRAFLRLVVQNVWMRLSHIPIVHGHPVECAEGDHAARRKDPTGILTWLGLYANNNNNNNNRSPSNTISLVASQPTDTITPPDSSVDSTVMRITLPSSVMNEKKFQCEIPIHIEIPMQGGIANTSGTNNEASQVHLMDDQLVRCVQSKYPVIINVTPTQPEEKQWWYTQQSDSPTAVASSTNSTPTIALCFTISHADGSLFALVVAMVSFAAVGTCEDRELPSLDLDALQDTIERVLDFSWIAHSPSTATRVGTNVGLSTNHPAARSLRSAPGRKKIELGSWSVESKGIRCIASSRALEHMERVLCIRHTPEIVFEKNCLTIRNRALGVHLQFDVRTALHEACAYYTSGALARCEASEGMQLAVEPSQRWKAQQRERSTHAASPSATDDSCTEDSTLLAPASLSVFATKIDWAFRNEYMGCVTLVRGEACYTWTSIRDLVQTVEANSSVGERGGDDSYVWKGCLSGRSNSSTSFPDVHIMVAKGEQAELLETNSINFSLLKRTDVPILLFESLDLFEDELHDCGASTMSVRVRVMPQCWYVLLQHIIRVDHILLQVMETRWFCSVGEGESPCKLVVSQNVLRLPLAGGSKQPIHGIDVNDPRVRATMTKVRTEAVTFQF